MSTFIPPTPAANKSAQQHQEPSEQDSFNHLLYKVLRLTSEQVQDLNDWMAHQGIPNVHEVIAQNFCKPHALEDNLKFITQGKTSYIQSNVMISLSLMISYIKHRQYSAKSKYFGPFYYIQIDPQDYDEWHTSPPEEEIHFQTPSKFGSPTTPRSTVSSEASESYITLTNFKKGIKRDASAYPIFKNERYYNTFICHFKATAKAQGLNSLVDPNFTPGSDEHEQQLFQEQQDFLYSVLISSLKTEFSEALIQFPPEMDENWVRYGLAKLGQISRLPNWQRMLFCAYTTQLLHSTVEVCWNNNDSYFIWFEFVCRNSGQIASRRSWKRSCLGLEYTSKCSRLALLWEPN